jgi:hypothetical protein
MIKLLDKSSFIIYNKFTTRGASMLVINVETPTQCEKCILRFGCKYFSTTAFTKPFDKECLIKREVKNNA